jgi:hypothetical protein
MAAGSNEVGQLACHAPSRNRFRVLPFEQTALMISVHFSHYVTLVDICDQLGAPGFFDCELLPLD